MDRAERDSGADAEVSGVCRRLYCDCYRRGDFGVDGGTSAADGSGTVRRDADVCDCENIAAQGPRLSGTWLRSSRRADVWNFVWHKELASWRLRDGKKSCLISESSSYRTYCR